MYTFQQKKPNTKSIKTTISIIKDCDSNIKNRIHQSSIILSKLKMIYYKLLNLFIIQSINNHDTDLLRNFSTYLFDESFHQKCLEELIYYLIINYYHKTLNFNYDIDVKVNEFFNVISDIIDINTINIDNIQNSSQEELKVIVQLIRRSIQYDKTNIMVQIKNHIQNTTKSYIGRFLKNVWIYMNIQSPTHVEIKKNLMKRSIEKFIEMFFSSIDDDNEEENYEIKISNEQNKKVDDFVKDAKDYFIQELGELDLEYDSILSIINDRNNHLDKQNSKNLITYVIITLIIISRNIQKTSKLLKKYDYLLSDGKKMKTIKNFNIIPQGNYSSSYIH